jgi:hypothetical protein
MGKLLKQIYIYIYIRQSGIIISKKTTLFVSKKFSSVLSLTFHIDFRSAITIAVGRHVFEIPIPLFHFSIHEYAHFLAGSIHFAQQKKFLEALKTFFSEVA